MSADRRTDLDEGEFNSITGPDGELELQPIDYKLGHAKKPVLWDSGRTGGPRINTLLIGRGNIACKSSSLTYRSSLTVRIFADNPCFSLPSLSDIFADAKPEPLIEPGNASAIG
jgi:hypothetical protein